jgi:hypothetical protein
VCTANQAQRVTGGSTDPEQSPATADDQQWIALLARYDLLQAAARLAWEALLEAYKPSADGLIDPSAELLERYQQAVAVRQAAELALFRHVNSGKSLSIE